MVATEELIDAIRARVGNVARIGYRVVVALTDNDDTITIADGEDGISVEAGGEEADTTVRLSSANLQKLMDGKLNPLVAYSTGRLKVEGSQGVALKLAGLLQGED
ncbi:putative sterol carrier protein [Pseudochelatococcus lubricantis]|uniref:Sterol carrier protein n=1 Tax=Pseudochelatococcus lubricantis TaxID=1538102 RepID=A0ABX0V0Y9_9HYPH|nr:SCP2 sterol-binding domain-containing protein [Pseudochelatococcus lubricantis]NIJ57774.1 putative sterol carrier protein [Pseudochelatococcus lubricantis]